MLFLLITPILSIKALIRCLSGVGGELAFGQMSTMLPPQLLASEIKQTFLSINLACLQAFERQQLDPPHISFANIMNPLIYKMVLRLKYVTISIFFLVLIS